MGGSLAVLALVVVVAVALLAGCGIVRCAELLRDTRADLIAHAAAFNARMVVEGRPHVWVVPAPSRTERTVYAAADLLSPRRRRRTRHAAAARAAMGGGR